MFALFFSLYLAMFTGTWRNFALTDIPNITREGFNAIGTFLTSILNNVDTPMTDLGDKLTTFVFYQSIPSYIGVLSFILALITSIGIVVVAIKGIRRVFGVFFMGLR